MANWIWCTKPSGEQFLLNGDAAFVIDRHEMERSSHTLVFPASGGDPVIITETLRRNCIETDATGSKRSRPNSAKYEHRLNAIARTRASDMETFLLTERFHSGNVPWNDFSIPEHLKDVQRSHHHQIDCPVRTCARLARPVLVRLQDRCPQDVRTSPQEA